MIRLRHLSPADLDLVCHQRAAIFREAGTPDDAIDIMAPAFRTWLAPRLADGRYFGFVAQTGDGVPAGGIGLMEIEWPPHPSHPLEDRRGYVLNVYVDPRYRNQGIARLLMEASDHVFQERGLSYVILHATDAGRRLYERIGWLPTSEMAKQLPPA